MAEPEIFGGFDAGSVYVTLGALVDESGFARYDALVASAKGHRSVKRKLEIDYDDSAFQQFKKDMAFANQQRQKTTKVRIDVDDEGSIGRTRRSLAEVDVETDRWHRRLRLLPPALRGVTAATAGLFGSVGRLSLSLGPLSGKLVNLFNSAAALSPVALTLAGNVGALAASLISGAEGAGVLALALGGLTTVALPAAIAGVMRLNAVWEVYKDRQKGVEDTALAAMKAQRGQADTADQLRDASQGVARAQRAVKEATKAARDEIVQAGKAVKDSRDDVRRAERDLATARQDAARDVRDAVATERTALADATAANREVATARREALEAQEAVNRSVRDAAMGVRGAELDRADAADALGDALQRVAELEAQGLTGTEEHSDAVRSAERAQHSLARAEIALRDAREDSADALKDQNRFQQEGLRAHGPYVQALEQQRQATERLREAQEDASRARAEYRRGTRSVQDAEERLADARESLVEDEERLAELREQGIARNPQVVGAVEQLRDAWERLGKARRGATGPDTPTSVLRAEVGLEDLSRAEKQLLRTMERFGKQWKTMLAPASDEVLSGMADMINQLLPTLELFSDEWDEIGEAIGDVLRGIGQDLTSPEWLAFYQLFADAAPEAIEDTGDALRALLGIIRDLSVAALPHLIDGLDWLARNLREVDDAWTPDTLRDDVDGMAESFGNWMELIGAVIVLLHDFGAAGAEAGDSLVERITDLVEGWSAFLRTEEGQEALIRFLERATEFAERLIDLVIPALEAISTIGTTIMDAVNSLGGSTDTFGKLFGIFLTARFLGITKLLSGLMDKILKVGKAGPIAGLLGGGAATAAGTASGAAAGAAAGSAGGVGARGLLRGASRVAGRALPGVGAYLGFATAIDMATPDLDTLTQRLDSLIEGPREGRRASAMRQLARDLEAAKRAGDPKRLRDVAGAIDKIAKSAENVYVRRELKKLADDVRDVARSKEFGRLDDRLFQVRRGFKVLANDTEVSMRDVKFRVRVESEAIEKDLGKHTEAGRIAMQENFRLAVKAIRKAMRDGSIATDKGAREIKRLMIESLKMYGFTQKQAEVSLRGRNPRTGQLKFGDDVTNDPSTSRPFARGGFVGRMGEKGRDKIHAVLGKGEAVLNHYQQKIVNAALRAVGIGGLGDVFQRTRGRKHWMDEGGFAGYDRGGFVQGAMSQGLQPQARSFAEQMFRLGYSVTSAMRPGDPRQHGQGMALDFGDSVNNLSKLWGLLFPQRGQFNQLLGPWGLFNGTERFYNAQLQADHMDHIHVGFAGMVRNLVRQLAAPRVRGGGAVGAMAQGALNMIARAANSYLGSVSGSSSSYAGPDHGPGGPGMFGKTDLVKLWNTANPGVGNANLMAAIALAESSGDPAAHGPPDGRGLWQIEWPVWGSTMARHGLTDAYNAWQNANMAEVVLNQQGLGAWVVYNTGAYRQFLEDGGVVFADAGLDPGTPTSRGGGGPRTVNQWAKSIREQLGKIPGVGRANSIVSDLEERYGSLESRFALSEESFVILGDEDTPASVNQDEVNQRVKEIDRLIGLRERILKWLRTIRQRMRERIEAMRDAIARLTKARDRAKKKDRPGYTKLIRQYRDQLRGAVTGQVAADTAVKEAASDLATLRDERSGLTGGGTVAGLISELSPEQGGPKLNLEPDPNLGGPGEGGGGGSPLDGLQMAELLELRNRVAFYTALAGPGDIGPGYASVQDAVRSGTPAARLPTGIMSQAQAAAFGGAQFVQNNYMLQPDDPKVLTGLASTAVKGFSMQPFRATTRESHQI